MTTEMPRSRVHPASGTDAPTSGAIPSRSSAEPESPASRDARPSLPLPLPGLPAGMDPKRLLWYGGLAALATVGVLEWPVAAVVGAGSYVAERWAREDARRDAQQRS